MSEANDVVPDKRTRALFHEPRTKKADVHSGRSVLLDVDPCGVGGATMPVPLKPIEPTADQKLRLAFAHRQLLATKVSLSNLQETVKQHEAQWNAAVNSLVSELKIDTSRYLLDIDQLVFVPNK